MGTGKHQLTLTFLVVVLGAAVYLNWVSQGEGPLIATDTLTSGVELGMVQPVNGKDSNSASEASSSTSSTSPKAVKAAAKVDEYFTETKLSR